MVSKAWRSTAKEKGITLLDYHSEDSDSEYPGGKLSKEERKMAKIAVEDYFSRKDWAESDDEAYTNHRK